MFWNGDDFVPGSSTALGYTPVNKAGDTMSGALYLPSATPTLSTQAATKGYVDSAVSGAVGSNFVLKTGDTMTGPLVLSGAPSTSLQAATKGYVDGVVSSAGYATETWVTNQNYANTSTQSLLYYYTKTDSDNRYVSVSTQNLVYYPLSTTVASTYVALAGTQTVSGAKTFSSAITASSGVTTATNSGLSASAVNFYNSSYSSGIYNSIFLSSGSGLSSQNIVFAFNNSGSSTQVYYFNGNGTASATNWNSTSDVRIKENIKDVTNALDTIDQLRPIEFSYTRDKRTTSDHFGLIAQELEGVLPQLVADSGMNDGDVQNIKSVSYTQLIPILIKAVQELKAEVDALKAAK